MRRLIQLDAALVLAALFGCLLAYAGPRITIETLQFDLALAQNFLFRGTEPRESRVAVVAVDERSLEKLEGMARVALAPRWAELIEALAAADATAIGFDIVFAYPDTHLAQGWEKSFLTALYRHRRRIVLARSERVVPSRRFQAVLAFEASDKHFGAIEVRSDRDHVHRTVPARIRIESPGKQRRGLPTFSKLLLDKAGSKPMPAVVRLAPKRPLETLPTYSLWNVLSCAGARPEMLRRAFADKIILVGTTLPGEDRKWTPDRFMHGGPRAGQPAADECRLDGRSTARNRSRLVPSVYLHAAAIDAVMRDEVLRTAPEWLRIGLGMTLAFAAVWIGFLLRPLWATVAIAAAGLVLQVLTASGLEFGLWLATASLWLGMAFAALIAYLVRFLLVERQARLIRQAFNTYLSEELVDRIAAAGTRPETGGARRDVTVMFADLSGFTELSERLTPEALMELTNDYLQAIAGEVDSAQGYVDKFIGDGVMAIWGAPADEPNHALRAVEAAIRIVETARARFDHARANGGPGFDVRVALSSGPAVVGNVGARNKLNYSALGRTVNIAARLSGLASDHDTSILLSGETAELVGGHISLRSVGEAQLKGIREKVELFTPAAAVTPESGISDRDPSRA